MDALPAKKPPRLRFIDMARAVAILLMLEGHFIHLLLGMEWRNTDHEVFKLWWRARGLAAPMFFTVTGLIFAYLISGSKADTPFFQLRRVRRGFLRVGELMFWGYLLQLHPRLLTGTAIPRDSWFLTFHVLQCIGVGLVAMIVIYGLLRRLPQPALIAAFTICGFGVFLAQFILANADGYLPPGWPAPLQNPIRGPGSHFPLSPWLAFTFYGAAIGVYARHCQQKTPEGEAVKINPIGFLVIGALLATRGWPMDAAIGRTFLDLIGITGEDRVTPFIVHGRFGESLFIIGLLVCFERWVKCNTLRFEIIGRNTFPIYVTHVVILYGGIFGIGLNSFKHSLNPWQAIAGAVVFCGFFAVMAQYVDPIQKWLKSKRPAFLGGPPKA